MAPNDILPVPHNFKAFRFKNVDLEAFLDKENKFRTSFEDAGDYLDDVVEIEDDCFGVEEVVDDESLADLAVAYDAFVNTQGQTNEGAPSPAAEPSIDGPSRRQKRNAARTRRKRDIRRLEATGRRKNGDVSKDAQRKALQAKHVVLDFDVGTLPVSNPGFIGHKEVSPDQLPPISKLKWFNWDGKINHGAAWLIGQQTPSPNFIRLQASRRRTSQITGLMGGIQQSTRGHRLEVAKKGLLTWRFGGRRRGRQWTPGTTILFPSALITHSNLPTQPGETRYSIVQYTAGGLFRWISNGGMSDKEFLSTSTAEQLAQRDQMRKDRARSGLRKYTRLFELECGDYKGEALAEESELSSLGESSDEEDSRPSKRVKIETLLT
ncbi:hypothetical protein VNI00_015524 [Paramarasmius palmivorus]|uniref:Uncharacterized protein n=1 Tax=Paramarasmius palmivorus TaxID=297713 RepID=A0AAW0BKU2_9AGAR